VSIRGPQHARTTEPLVVPDANGAWSVTLPASQLQWDGSPDIPFEPGAGTVSASCVTEPNGRMLFAYADEVLTIGGGTTPPPTSNCKDVLLVGLIGSGQVFNGKENTSVSPEVQTAISGFLQDLQAGKTYRVQMLDYPALPVETIGKYLIPTLNLNKGLREYLEGKNTGVRKFRNLVEQQMADCPNQLIVPVGYSQGALVAHEYMVEHAKNYYGAKKQIIGAAVTIADPAQYSGSKVRNFGDAPKNAMGICEYTSVNCFKNEAVSDIPAAYTGRTMTVCYKRDAVCDQLRMASTLLPGMGFPAGFAIHKDYGFDPQVEQAGKRAAQKVNARWN